MSHDLFVRTTSRRQDVPGETNAHTGTHHGWENAYVVEPLTINYPLVGGLVEMHSPRPQLQPNQRLHRKLRQEPSLKENQK